MRRSVVANETAAQDFVLDDRIVGDSPPGVSERPQLHLDDAEIAPDSAPDSDPDSRPIVLILPKENSDPVASAVGARPEAAPTTRRILPPAFWLLGAALLGGVFFVFQRDHSSTRPADVSTLPSPSPSPPPPSLVAPVAIPSAPTQPQRRPAGRAVAAAPGKKGGETTQAGAPSVVPPAPKPAVPKAAAPAVSVPAPTPPHPDPPAFVAGKSVPVDVDPAPASADEEGWFKLAEEYLQLGDDNRAEALYRRILNEGDQQGRAALALGDLYARRNDFNRAQEFYRASKRLFQNSARQTSPP